MKTMTKVRWTVALGILMGIGIITITKIIPKKLHMKDYPWINDDNALGVG